MNSTLRLGLVGLGKIARDEHLPAIVRTAGVELRAVASRNATAEGVANYPDLAAMLSAEPELDAIVLCQPPQPRYDAARAALLAGKHVFLEKPPGATLSEVAMLAELAARQGVTLFASWHSRWSASVADLKAWCAPRTIRRVTIEWKEDVHRWHPGQEWIWEAGGFGVFDPGINALSILTAVVPGRIRLIDARLQVPANRAAPIAVDMLMETSDGAPVSAAFDWRQTGPQTWRITVETADERHVFAQGGEEAGGEESAESALAGEYCLMYRHFVDLIRTGRSDVDVAPLQLVADAFMLGKIETTAPFTY